LSRMRILLEGTTLSLKKGHKTKKKKSVGCFGVKKIRRKWEKDSFRRGEVSGGSLVFRKKGT